MPKRKRRHAYPKPAGAAPICSVNLPNGYHCQRFAFVNGRCYQHWLDWLRIRTRYGRKG